MGALSGLFKTVLYRVIFNSLVGVVALLLIVFLYNPSHYATTNPLINYYLKNIWIVLLLMTLSGEILCSFGETVTLLIFNFNSIVRDDHMETIEPCYLNKTKESDIIYEYEEKYMTYKNFVSMLNSNETAAEFSEINFVLGRVFSGLGVIALIVTFYLYLFTGLNIVIGVAVVIILIFLIINFSKSAKSKSSINTIALLIMLAITFLIAYVLKNSNILMTDNHYLLLSLSMLLTIFFFYISVLYVSFANKLNKVIYNSPKCWLE